MYIKIKRRNSKEVIHSGNFDSIKECLEDGVRKGISFAYADLIGANLSNSNLSNCNLSYSDLSYSDLSYTNLSGTNLHKAKLDKKKFSIYTGRRRIPSLYIGTSGCCGLQVIHSRRMA